jgi:hypothetical protein
MLTSCDVQREEGRVRARAAVRETEQANEELLKLSQQKREKERQADAQIAGHRHSIPNSSHLTWPVSQLHGDILTKCSGLLCKEACKMHSKLPN